MKKKTFGRIAALGLAGLTAVPAISIVASADISYTGKQDAESKKELITGTAYKLTWDVQKIDHNYSFDKIKNIIVDNPEVTVATTTTNPTIAGSAYKLQETRYYGYDVNAGAIPSDITAIVNNANKTNYNDPYKEYSDECDDFAFYNKCVDTASKSQYTIKSANGKGTTYYYGNYTTDKPDEYGFYVYDETTKTYTKATYPFATAPANPAAMTEYKFTTSPTKSSVSMATLANELGTSFVEINGNVITAAAKDTTGAYKLSTSGSTSTVVPGGNYAQYEIPTLYRYASNTSYYSYDTNTWYPNTSSFYYAVGYYPNSAHSSYWTSKAPSPAYSSVRRYFDPTTGNYYTYAEAGAYGVLVNANAGSDYTENYVYKSSTTGLYYLTWSAANNATGSNGTVEPIRAVPTYASFFSMRTGQFYSTYEAAYYNSGNNSSYVIAINGASSITGINGLDYIDPYYYYFMGNRNQNTSSNDTSSVKIGNRTGWTAVASSAKSAKNGSTLNVSMNGETVVPSNVLANIQGRNVTVNFTLKNGVVYTINGNDVSSAKNIDIDTIYNTKNVPSKLVSKAKSKNNGVSTSQLTIDSGSFGSSADVTVKFATKRAGCTARLYRYNSDRNSLSLVDKSTVNSSGKCTFDGVTKGGDYVIVLS